MPEPIITQHTTPADPNSPRFSATGASFSVHEWRGSGPALMHVHHNDDEAWHVLEGMLRFRFNDRTVDVTSGGTVFVPAGVPHTYEAIGARYLIILTPRLASLIHELQNAGDRSKHAEIYRSHDSELLEG